MDGAGKSPDVGSASADAALGRAFAEIAPNAPFVIYQFRIRADGTFGFPIVSSGFQDLFGVQPGDVAEKGGPAFSRVHPDDRKKLLDGILEVHRTLAPWHGEFRVRSPRGEVWVEGRSSGHREPDGSTLWFGVLFDVTERKRIEEALREREEQLRATFEVAPVGVAQADPVTGRFVTMNPRMCLITGYSAEELLAMRVPELTHPEDRERDWALFQKVVKDEAPEYRIEKRYVRKDGSVAWVNVNMVVLRDTDGRPTRTLGLIEDITDRKKGEEALRASEQRFRAMFDVVPVGVAQADPATGQLLAVNPRMALITGYSAEELLRMSVAQITHPEDREQDRKMFQSIVGGEARECRIEKRYVRKDGDVAWVNANVVVLPDEAGRPTRTLATIEDVTERRRAAEALVASESRYRVLFENAAEGIVAIDPGTGRFQFFNPSVCAMFGYTPEEFGELTLSDLHPKEAFAQALNAIRAAVDGFRPGMASGIPCRKKDGTTFLADVHGSVVTLARRKIAFGFFTEVTARVRLEEQLRQAQKMQAIGQLAGGVAHDFNNLLTVISGNCELLLSSTSADDRRRDSLVDIRSASERAASLTRQLLAFSRKQILEPRLVDVHEVVSGIEKMLRRLIGEDVDLHTDLAADPSWVKVDPGQLEQVVMNLVVNARDAMPRGGRIMIRTRNADPAAAIELEETGDRARRPRVVISISDSGSGITPGVKAHLFEPFFTTKAAGKGTGLGLATVYGIVKQSGGDITVESEPGKGATFRVFLPSQPASRARGASGTHRALPRGTETALVVEDEDAVRRIVKIALESTGYRVLEARNGTEALELVRQHAGEIHILVTDVVMPEMSGRELAERIAKEDHPGVKILYMSGYTDDAIVRHGIVEAGAAFLQKPFSPLALARKVREALDGAG